MCMYIYTYTYNLIASWSSLEPLEIVKIKFYIKNYKAMYNFSLSYF